MGNLLHNKWLVAILILAVVAAAGGYLLLAPTTPETSKGIVLERSKIARPEKPSSPTDPDQPTPSAPAKRDVVGTVSQFKGLAFANFENIKRTLADGDPLFQGDQIITGKDARLILKMQDDAVIALGPDSEFLIQEYQFSAKDQTGNGLVNMTQGMVKFTSGKIAQLKNRPFKVVTPVATMGVRGTEGFARLVKGQSKDLEIEVITLQKEILVWMEDPSSRTTGSLGEIYFSPAWSFISEALAADTSKEPVNVKKNERLSGSPNKAPEVRKATRDELKGAHASTMVRKLSAQAQKNIVTQLAKSLVEKGAAKDIKSAEQMLAKSPEAIHEVIEQAEEKLHEETIKTIDKKLDKDEKVEQLNAKIKETVGEEAFAKMQAAEEKLQAKQESLQHEAEMKLKEKLGDETLVAAAKEIEADKADKKTALAMETEEKLTNAVGEQAMEKLKAIEAEKEQKAAALEKETEKALQETLGTEKAEQVKQLLAEKADTVGLVAKETEEALKVAVPEEKLFEKAKEIAALKAAKQDMTVKELNDQLKALPDVQAAKVKEILLKQEQENTKVEKTTTAKIKEVTDAQKYKDVKAILNSSDQKVATLQKEVAAQIKAVVPPEQVAKTQAILNDKAAQTSSIERKANQQMKEALPPAAISQVKSVMAETQELTQAAKIETTKQVAAVVPPEKQAAFQTIQKEKEQVQSIPTVNLSTLSTNKPSETQQKEAVTNSAVAVEQFAKKIDTAVKSGTPLDQVLQNKAAEVKTQQINDASQMKVNLNDANTVQNAVKQSGESPGAAPTTIPVTPTTPGAAGESTGAPSTGTVPKTTPEPAGGSGDQTDTKPDGAVKPAPDTGKPATNTPNAATDVPGPIVPPATGSILGLGPGQALEPPKSTPAATAAPAAAAATSVATSIPVNRAPTMTAQTFKVNELAPNGTKVGTLTASDQDVADQGKLTYALNDTSTFIIDSKTGVITVKDSAKLIFATTPTFTVPATVQDPKGAIGTAQITIQINPPPVVTSANTASFAENNTGTVYIATATGLDTTTLTWSLAGPDANLFKITQTTGEVSFNTSPDFENPKDADKKNIYNINVVATDKDKLTASKTVAITVTNLNDAPVITSALTATFAENSTGTAYTATATDLDAGDAISWSLIGADAALFDLDASKGTISFKTSPDFEKSKDKNNQNKYNLTVTATDKALASTFTEVTITVTDVNETPVITSEATANFAENGTGTVYTSTGSDPDNGDPIKWSLTGPDASLFKIQLATGVVTFNTPPNFEDPKSADKKNIYNITVVATDKGDITASKPVVITVTNVNEAPVITSASTATFAENSTGTAYTATATDLDAGDAITWSLTGVDAALFDIDASKGTISFKTSPDFENSKDKNNQIKYNITMTATDKALASTFTEVTITVTDVNETPVITSEATANFTENGTGTVYTATGSDPDNGDPIKWSLTGPDASLFKINLATGVVTFNTPPNFEDPKDADKKNIYKINVVATDKGDMTASKAVAITVTNVNEDPVITSASTATFAENSTSTAYTATATDVDAGDAITWSLTGVDAALFDIDASKGTISFKTSPDFEKSKDKNNLNKYNITVTATDKALASTSTAVTITVIDINETPVITSEATANFAENSAGTAYTASGSDPDNGDPIKWSLTGPDATLFKIQLATDDVPLITFITPPNFEDPKDADKNNIYNINVVATDKGDLTASKAVAITVTNVNEAPAITSAPTATFAENNIGAVYTAAAMDPDASDTINWSLTGTDAALFDIGASTGIITFKTPPDFEVPKDGNRQNTYKFNVVVTDKGALTNSKALTVSVTDVNEAPIVTSEATASFAENSTGTVITATANDSDAGDTVTWSLTGTDKDLFDIDTNKGSVTFKTAPNFEAPKDQDRNNIYEIILVATDKGKLTGSKAVAISVTNVYEAPQVTSNDTASFVENAIGPVLTATASGVDANDSLTLTWSLSGKDASLFDIDTTTGILTFKVPPNFESPKDSNRKNTYEINLIATNNGRLPGTMPVTITVTDINDPPQVTSAAVASFAENKTGTVYAPTASDEDTNDSVTWTLSGVDAALFNLDPTTGIITFKALPNYEKPKDVNEKNIYNLTVTVTDRAGLTGNKAVAITIINANDAPQIISGATASFVENATGTVYTATGTDEDTGDTIQWSLSENDAPLFAIDPATGAVTFKTPPNFEFPKDTDRNNIYEISLTATDKEGSTANKPIAITVSNLNDAPVITSAATTNFTEFSTATAYTATGTDEDDDDTITWALTGTDASQFNLNTTTGLITFKTPPATATPQDADANNIYALNVIATDNVGLSTSKPLAITVAKVTNFPVISSSNTALFAENDTAKVYTATATGMDPGNTGTWSVTGADVALFKMDATTGDLTFKTPPNFEFPTDTDHNNVYDINVVTSIKGGQTTKAVAITVTNVNDAIVITSTGSASFAENGTGAVITATATDEDAGDTLTWSLTGTDANLFDINPATGAVIFKKSPDFEAPKDMDINNIYAINVVATDKGGLTTSKAVAITVTDVNEAPTITSGQVASFAENSTGKTYTATGTDLDAGDTLSWSIIGTDAAWFKIDSATGDLSFKTPPNYEDPKDLGGKNIYNLTVVATDKGGLTASKAVAITVNDANDAPQITSGATASFPENSTGAAYTAVATDEDTGDSLTWSLTGADAGLFKIDSTTRVVSFKTPPDFESPKDFAGKNIYNINVIATDKSGSSASKAVTITVTNTNEAPTVTSGPLASFSENNTGTLYTATATDVDASDTITWTLTGMDVSLFAIDATKGSVTFITPPNFEDPKDVGRDNVYDITVIATDKGGLSASKAVAITVTDLNDAPQITSASTASFAENATATAYAAVGNDEDKGDPLTWSLSGQDVALFTIDAATGAVTFKTPPDFETPRDSAGKNSYNINVIVTDKAGLSATKAVAITVTNVNEAPAVTSGATATFAENSTSTVATATATDVDAGDTFTWSLTGVDASLFNIDASKGTITFKTPPSFEAPNDADHNNVYEINTIATDKGGLSGSKALSITVTNLNDAPQVTSTGSASFLENGTGTVYTAIASDEDAGDVITWSLSGTDAALFDIEATTGAVTFKTPPNFEAPKDSDGNNVYDIIVVATDKGKVTGSKPVAITVTNLNETPVITSPASANFAENGTGTVYVAIGTDADAGDAITWSLTGTDATLFSMDSTTGIVTFKNSPDFESPKDADRNNVYEITVMATDKAGKSTSMAVAITVTNLNETPVAVDDTGVATEAGGIANAIAGSSATGNVLTNDTDPEKDPLTVTAIRSGSVKGGGQTGTLATALAGTHGLLTLKSDGSYTYVVSENNPTVQALKVGQTISDSFNYTVSDGKLTDMSILTITIQGANDAPVGVNDTGSATETGGTANGTAGSNATGNVLTNDTDPETDTLTATAIRTGDVEGNGTSGKIGTAITGNYGSLTLNSDGSYTYIIDNTHTAIQALKVNQTLTDGFNFTLSDGTLTDMAQLTITIKGANDAPVGVDDTGSATEAGGTANGTAGSTATGNVLSNDTDPESDTLTAIAIRMGNVKGSGTAGAIGTAMTGSYGSLTLATNGAYTYSVNNNNPTVQALKVGQTLSDAFNYTLSDGNAADMALLTITINGANDAPVGVNDTGNATEASGIANATVGSNATGNVLTNNTDAESDSLTVTAIRLGNVKGEGIVGILGTSLTSTYGALTLNSSGDYTYIIDNTNSIVDKLPVGQTLTDSFNYTFSDGTLTDTAVLTITIHGANETPIGVDDAGTATEASGTANGTAGSSATGTLLTNDTDMDTGSTLTVTAIRVGSTEGSGTAGTISSALTGSYGSLTVNTNSSYTYLVNEANTTVQALKVGQSITDTFNYTLSDGTLTDTALLTLTINGANDGPIAVDNTSNATEAGGTLNGTAGSTATGNVITNDTDPESDALTVTAIRLGSVEGSGTVGTVGAALTGTYGSLTLTDTGSYTYLVSENNAAIQALKVGNTLTESFNYTASDGSVSDIGVLTIIIQGANDAPSITSAATASFAENSTGTVYTSTATDPEGDTLLWSLSGTDAAKFTIDPVTGAIQFITPPNYEAATDANLDNVYSVIVIVTDNGTGTLTASQALDITVSNVNDAPAITAPAPITATEDTSVAFSFSVADEDAGTNTIQAMLSATNGKLTLTQLSGVIITSGSNTSANIVFTGTLSQVNGALTNMTYQGDTNYSGAETITLTVNDQGNTGPGGAKTTTATTSFTVTAVNDAPTLVVPTGITATEDTSVLLTGISVADVDAGTSSIAATLSAVHGKLTLATGSGVTVTFGANATSSMVITGTLSQINAALAGLSYQGDQDYNGAETVSITINDQGNTGTGGALTATGSINFTLVAVNDTPVITIPTSANITEDISGIITGISISDVDVGTGTMTATLNALKGKITLTSGSGVTITAGANTSSSMALSGTLSQLNAALVNLTYLGNQDYYGSESLTIAVDDLGNTGPDGAKNSSKTLTFTITAVNDAPVITGTPAPTVTEDIAAIISGWSVSDVDIPTTGSFQATLSALHGTITLKANSGISVITGTDGSSSMIFTGTLAQVNAAILDLTYLGTLNYNGTETVTLAISDQGNTGSGGAKTTSASVTFTIAPVNDTPTDITLNNLGMYEGADPGSHIAVLTAVDPDIGDTFIFSITAQDPANLFDVRNTNGSYLIVRNGANPAVGSYSVTLQVTDAGSLSLATPKSFTITVVAVPFTLDTAANVGTPTTIKTNSETVFKDILLTLNTNPSSKTLINSDVETLILGKLGQQFSSGGTFTNEINQVIKRLTVDITPTLVTIMARVGLINTMYSRLPTSTKGVFDGLFNTFAPYATDYTTDIRLKLFPIVDNTAKTLAINTTTSTVEILHLQMLPNINMSLNTMLTAYNNALPSLKTDGSLTFFTGGGGTGPTGHILSSKLGLSSTAGREREKSFKATALANGITDQYVPNGDSRAIPTSQRFDYYLPGMINSISLNTGSITLTR